MKTYNYKNYSEYMESQKKAFTRKFKNIWAKEENIKAIAEFMKNRIPKRGLCHGVRQGYEVDWFRKYLPGCEVFGTDIGKVDHLYVFQHDFNMPHEAFVGNFDFIYSNSFDHAFNPQSTLEIWSHQIMWHGGYIILEYDRRQEHTGEVSKGINKTDPVSIKFSELQVLIPKWIKVKNIKILDMPIITQEWRKAMVIEI